MLHQAAMLIIFFAAAVPKDSQRFSKAVCKHESFLCHLTCVQSMAKPTGSKVEISTPFRRGGSSNCKACGSKVKEQLQKWHSKGIAASQRTKPSQKTTV